tara:strand:- start:241 stop:363 length:123 start_codon:yes stop_codon:yes gene_type:complete
MCSRKKYIGIAKVVKNHSLSSDLEIATYVLLDNQTNGGMV